MIFVAAEVEYLCPLNSASGLGSDFDSHFPREGPCSGEATGVSYVVLLLESWVIPHE